MMGIFVNLLLNQIEYRADNAFSAFDIIKGVSIMGIQDWSEDIVLVKLAKEPEMGDELLTVVEMVRQKDGCDVVVDFSDIDIMTSSSIAKLLKLRKVLVDCGRDPVLCGVGQKTMNIFGVTGLDKVFRFAEDQFIALASLQLAS
jgi:anti-anti-sigma factor